MLFVLLLNSATIIASQFEVSDDWSDIFEVVDEISFYFYVFEWITKMVGIGITKYFNDGWNQFDFSMVLLSAIAMFLQSAISVLKSAKSVKSSRILRITKINKLFRAFKAFRTMKFCHIFINGAEMLLQLQNMIERIFLCLPFIFKFVPLMIMIFYIWAIIGMDNFNTNTHPYREGSPYLQYSYANFDSFVGAISLLY
jgi:two pore calcium channel protein 1/two pore calcium channel protein 3